jgi:hypothetical protein
MVLDTRKARSVELCVIYCHGWNTLLSPETCFIS